MLMNGKLQGEMDTVVRVSIVRVAGVAQDELAGPEGDRIYGIYFSLLQLLTRE